MCRPGKWVRSAPCRRTSTSDRLSPAVQRLITCQCTLMTLIEQSGQVTPLSSFGAMFVLTAITLILLLPRRWAPIPLLFGTFYMTLSQGIQIGSINLFAIRLLLVAGFIRVFLRREGISGGLNRLDKLMLVWSVWAALSSVFHADPWSALKFNLGIAINACGSYFLLRIFCRSLEDAVKLCAITVVLLIPMGFEMYFERLTMHNAFSVLGGVSEHPQIREGRLRAQGPFAHAILAGTVGAMCLPLAIGLWKTHRKIAILGTFASITVVLTSASSGPVASGILALCALLMWPLRERMRSMRWLAIFAWAGLSFAMSAPTYYLIARVDFAGGSTGWYRARLIESAVEHFDEWWLGGTDYTRHWMATGLDSTHADITNHYIHMGLTGGMMLLILFVLILATAFRYVGLAVKGPCALQLPQQRFLAWALGASLFAHAVTFISVSYFDQSFILFYLTLAAIAAVVPPNCQGKSERSVRSPVLSVSGSSHPEFLATRLK
jgi:hypothetical protein